MTNGDQNIFKALRGRGDVVTSLCLYCVKRKGYLLLALPCDKKLAELALALYQPQTIKAKLLVKSVSIMIKLGLHHLLPMLNLNVRSESALSNMVKPHQELGFLLGNPDAEARKVIVVYQDGNKFSVAKVGAGKTAKRSVEEEARMIKSLPRNHIGIPHICECMGGDEWYYYSTSLIAGSAPMQGQDGQALGVLTQWMEHFELQKVRHSGVSDLLQSHARASESPGYLDFIKGIGDLEVKVGLYHGDYAPWNIKISDDRDVRVLDWEHARLDGFAGWDWLHYIIQRSTLVFNHSAVQVLDDCRVWAATPEGCAFLCAAGWGEHVEEWLGSYLMYSFWVAGFDREELLQVWSEGI